MQWIGLAPRIGRSSIPSIKKATSGCKPYITYKILQYETNKNIIIAQQPFSQSLRGKATMERARSEVHTSDHGRYFPREMGL